MIQPDAGLGSNKGSSAYDEMWQALSSFESLSHDASPKERAFYSALRTLLSDISMVQDSNQRDMRAMAAHNWFSKHSPRGVSEDPAIFAAMAASLSIGGAQQQQKPRTSLNSIQSSNLMQVAQVRG